MHHQGHGQAVCIGVEVSAQRHYHACLKNKGTVKGDHRNIKVNVGKDGFRLYEWNKKRSYLNHFSYRRRFQPAKIMKL